LDLSDALCNVADQDKGRWLDVLDPWSGKPIGMRFLIAGPDSGAQRRARITMMDELAEAAGPEGSVSFEARENARIGCLARCVLGWEIEDEGKPLPYSHKNVVRVLKGVQWVQAQVDAFAGDRRNFGSEG
jgi:hypothetical protein